ncbi:MAG: hypothetical protein Q8L22_25995 [Reyranella sp.]|nr:hypothetical protein [Reyranella sp.]
MSKLRTIPYAVLTISLFAAGGASAQSMWSIDQREAAQQQRIDAGRRDGSLTRSEASRLQQGEQRIDRYEARARADGVVTSGERQRLDGRLDRESRQINRERNDGQRAGGHDNGNHYGWDRGNHNGWNHNDQPPALGTTPPAHTGWNGNGQGTGQSTGTNGQNNGWTRGATHTASAPQATSYTHGAPARMIPASAPATPAVAPARAPSSGGQTSRH